MDAFVRMNAAEKNQIIASGCRQRIKRQVDSVIDRRQIIEAGRAIGVADGNEITVAILFINRHDLRRRKSVDGGQNRRFHQPGVSNAMKS